MSETIELKVNQNMRVVIQELIAQIECEDVKKVFLALGSSALFLNALNAADPDFKKKMDEMRKGMFTAGIDEREICKELEPELQLPEIAK